MASNTFHILLLVSPSRSGNFLLLYLLRDHFYITSAKELGGCVWKNASFADPLNLINNPKMFNGVTDDLALKPYISQKKLLL